MTIATKVLVVIGFLQGLGQAASSSNCAMLLEAPCFSQLWNWSAESPASGALKLDDRLPVPSSKDIRRARLELRRTYSAEYKRDGREDLEAMAREFLRIAQTASEPSDLRYTLLEEALEKAIDAGMCDLALTVVKTIGKTYKVNGRVLRYESLERLAKKHRGIEGALDDLAHLIRLTQDSRQARDYALADKSLTLARSRASNLGGEYLVDELNALRKRIAWEKKRWSKVERSTDALARAEFGFLIEGQLGQAAALLRPGEDARAADTEGLDVRLPQAEAAAPESSATHLEVGALWMQRAEGGKWVDTLPFRRRAITWYLRALEPMPKGPDRLSLEQQILEYYRSHHDPVRGVPVDPWELSSRLPTESLAVARSLLWHDFSIRTDRRWTYSKHSVYLHNLSAESFLEDRLRGQLSLLCDDGRGAPSVVRRELIYQARRHCLLGSWENEGEFVVWGTGGTIGNGEIEKQNNGDWIPKNAHLLITLDGVPIFESFWMKPTSLWWLAE